MSTQLIARFVAGVFNHIPASFAARLGSSTPLARALRPFVNRIVPRGPIVAVVRGGPARGIQLLIHPRGEKFYWTGLYEEPVMQAIADTLRPGDVFWDVGAHIGFFSAFAARIVGRHGHVHAFEPVPANRARLQAAIDLNAFTNVTAHPFGLAGESGEGSLQAGNWSTSWTLVGDDADANAIIRVDFRTLDELAGMLGPPDLIKVDAEGAEAEILRGGSTLLGTRQPTLILELHDRAWLDEVRALLPEAPFTPLNSRHWLISPGPSAALPGTAHEERHQ
jgi:FkbM family methyltransferase